MIKLKNWDSQFLGIKVGSLELTTQDDFHFLYSSEFQYYDVVYVFSNHYVLDIPESMLKDIKIDYAIHLNLVQVGNISDAVREIQSVTNREYQMLLGLAYTSGRYSRFLIDKKFPINTFYRLYKEWLDRSLDRSIAETVLGYYIGSQIVGFVTLNKVDDNKLRIGLIAVHPEYQGKRIGSFLLMSVFKYAIENSYHQLFVATQIDNQSASSFYEKAGFILHSKTHTYHIWQSLSPLTSLT